MSKQVVIDGDKYLRKDDVTHALNIHPDVSDDDCLRVIRDLRAARERSEQLERELERERASASAMLGMVAGQRDDAQRECDTMREAALKAQKELSESRARLAACEELISRLQEWTHIMGEALVPRGADSYGEGVRDCKAQVTNMLMAALSKLDADHPAPPEAKGDERAKDAHLAKARELYDAGYRTDAVGHLLAHLEQQRAPAPSKSGQDGLTYDGPGRWEVGFRNIVGILLGVDKQFEIRDVVEMVRELKSKAEQPAAVKPSEASPLPWRADGHVVFDARGARVCSCLAKCDAPLIAAIANRWHAEQGGEGQ